MPAINETLSSPADGHTIFAADASSWAIVPALQPMPYDFLRDFAPVTLDFSNGLIIVTGTASGINSLQELIARAKAKPGAMNYATPGIGSLHHLVLATLAASAGFEARHIPYKGAGEMVESILRDDTQFTMVSLGAVLQRGKGNIVTHTLLF